MKKGKIIILSGPSGSGKTTISNFLRSKISCLELSISCTTRKKRKHEIHGIDYYFLSRKNFFSKINKCQFLEWEEVYQKQFYGTLKSELHRIWKNNKIVLFDIDVKGGLNIKKQYPNHSYSIFLMVQSIDILKSRLIDRKDENMEKIKMRLKRVEYENNFSHLFDVIVSNNNLLETQKHMLILIKQFLY
ncbi:guanylate kinase [Blattabacterium cuenoti]|uniref:guanylate kinase n=1 Tax=Blattabacterium cuenoti TaxID=1653831 RepID=UPI00163D368A|nr:guanylate kinase [Blattabacterium cuenoti]